MLDGKQTSTENRKKRRSFLNLQSHVQFHEGRQAMNSITAFASTSAAEQQSRTNGSEVDSGKAACEGFEVCRLCVARQSHATGWEHPPFERLDIIVAHGVVSRIRDDRRRQQARGHNLDECANEDQSRQQLACDETPPSGETR